MKSLLTVVASLLAFAAAVGVATALLIWDVAHGGAHDQVRAPAHSSLSVNAVDRGAAKTQELASAPVGNPEPVAKPLKDDVSGVQTVPFSKRESRVFEGVGGNPDGLRPEDRGEDLSGLAASELVKWLASSTNNIELRKAAQVLGDRSIAGTLKLSAQESAAVSNVVRQYLKQTIAPEANDSEEAKEQIERLWWTAARVLAENIASPDDAVAEKAIKALSLMRNEEIVRALVDQARKATDRKVREMCIFALGCMTEKYESLVPRRTCMNEKDSRMLADKLIIPFLSEIGKTETDPDLRQAITQALTELKQAAEHRPVAVPLEKVDEQILRNFLAALEKDDPNAEICKLYRKELARRSLTNGLKSASP